MGGRGIIYGHNIARPWPSASCRPALSSGRRASRVSHSSAGLRLTPAGRCLGIASTSPCAPRRRRRERNTTVPPQLLHGAAAWSPCGVPVAVLSLSLSLSFSVSLTHSLAHCSPCTAPWILRRGEVLRVARSSGQARNDGIHCTAAISTREQRGAAHARSSLVPGVVHAAASVTAAPARLL